MALLFFAACSSDDDHSNTDLEEETENLQLVKSFENEGYRFDFYTRNGKMEVGHNQIYIQIEDPEGNFVEDAGLSWSPLMTMEMHGHDDGQHTDDEGPMMHQHSAPYSKITKTSGKNSLYEGYIVFLMPGSEMDFWELNLDFEIDGAEGELAAEVEVVDSETDYHKVYTSAMGADGEQYIFAMLEPRNPKVGINPLEVAVFKRKNDMEFPPVKEYKLKVDPRMPGMGNHSATGSEDLTPNESGFYEGKVAFSMTGYWKINLILQDEEGEILKGEAVTEENQESSLHFKLEF